MKPTSDRVQRALASMSRAEVLLTLSPRDDNLTRREIARLTTHLAGLDEPRARLRVAVVRTYTTELLREHWRFEGLLHGFEVAIHEAPYGVMHEEAGMGLADARPDITYFFLQLEDLHPRLVRPLASFPAPEWESILAAATDWVDSMLRGFRAATASFGVVTLLPAMREPELGQYDSMVPESSVGLRRELSRSVARMIHDRHNSLLFGDLDAIVGHVGAQSAFDRRLWLTSRFPWTPRGAQSLVRHLFRFADVLKNPHAKVIVLDADNTLWGGILGEDGIDGIALGPDYPGSAFVAFQRRLLDFQQRGILLAMCSKNNPEDVNDVLTSHPHQVLRAQDFAAIRVNWQPKVDNLRSLAEELNLGLDSFVYVDDSPHECLQVRRELPQVTVVATPAQPVDVPQTLDDVPSLEILSLSNEDRQRTAMYIEDRARKEMATRSTDHGQYLRSLQMTMSVSIDHAGHVPRIAQLTQKTNQFNLTTRRYQEADIERMRADPDWLVADFSLADRFGDSGVVGVALVKNVRSPTAEIDTFLMSCRVIGRGAETAFLASILQTCAERGAQAVQAAYLPTRKNALASRFLPDHGFVESNGTFETDLAHWSPPDESAITIVRLRNCS
ncbi:MAG TPA: HAD-IIIC family phosphatase [Gemmatimonadaceae bacterium]|jgi:FkbH-like protein|nr:HAD-IIIC family phosphatase [Gemmatimonadaceae bacterium]